VDRSYRLGILIVLGTLLASGVVCLGYSLGAAPSTPARAAQDLGDAAIELGSFRLTERLGRPVGDRDLADRVWVASFIFTNCPLSCPRITSVMKGLQEKLAASGVQLVSISVDPDRDTPEVLAGYARRFGADERRWWFLTGSQDDVERLIIQGFKLGMSAATEPEREVGAEPITHSDRLALVDRGNKVVGYFDTNDPAKIGELVAAAERYDRQAPGWVRRLPAINASLNSSCTLLLLLGWWLIRAGRVRAHATAMVLAVVTSALFLGSYLLYHYMAGSKPFQGVGPIRVVYFTILLSHTALATFGVVPLVGVTLARALRRQFDRHARIARVTYPIWLYVSVTGVVIYVLLYQLPVASVATVATGP
jgi:protein SCO1/2/putative membrane protein